MALTSVKFLIFVVAVFFLYWTVCKRSKLLQNSLLVLSSTVFYAWWDWRFLGLLYVTVLSTYFAGRWIDKLDKQKTKRKAVFVCTLVLNLGILFVFKYFNFFVQSFADVMSAFGMQANVSTLRILLPVGISFYTFTALSYCIDLYQRKVPVANDLLAYSSYVTFFPSILSGPISRAQKQLPRYLKRREFDYDVAVNSCATIIWGGVMKYCLADRLGIYVDAVYGNIAQHNGTTLLLTSVLYTIQIYADFAGYSMIAIGLGGLFGIKLPQNFDRPYFSKTVTEFWRRWHISLTTWFRDYLYFPLGGNRVSKRRWALNTMIVFVVSGLWHGAAYTFLIWGALHGLLMIAEKLIYKDKLKTLSDKFSFANLLRTILTFFLVSFAWIFFRAESLQDALLIISKIFTSHGAVFLDKSHLLLAAIALLLVFAHDFVKEYGLRIHLLSSKHFVIKYIGAIILLGYILTLGVLNGGSFIYFQF